MHTILACLIIRSNMAFTITGLVNKFFLCKIVNIFLPIFFSICFECSKEPFHCDGSFEYP